MNSLVTKTTSLQDPKKGFGGPLYYNYNKEPPKLVIGNYSGPYIRLLGFMGFLIVIIV